MPMNSSMEPSKTTLSPDVSRISPELALVDPELARRLRQRLPRKVPGHRPPRPVLQLRTTTTHARDVAYGSGGAVADRP
jgi:hypothetical protein